jgi:hypothetical protein
MPLYWTIDSKERLFIAVGEGEVTLDDAMSLLEAQAGAGAISYRKLFDGRAIQCSMTGEEILAVCVKVRASHEHAQVGALAIVCTQEQTVRFGRLLGALAAADRPIRLFGSPRKARLWLDLPTMAHPRTPGRRKKAAPAALNCLAISSTE